MDDSFTLLPFLVDTGGSFMIGGIFGGMLRHLFKLLGFIVGLQIALITYLDYIEFISIEWNSLERRLDILADTILTIGKPDQTSQGVFMNTLGIFGGFLLGFIVGFFYG
jgi:uncharacterized membrane protein (Fun14 family)